MATQERIREAGPKYNALQNTLSETDWAASALPTLQQRVKEAEASLKHSKDNIRRFDKQSKEQLERFQSLQHSGVKRAFHKVTGKLQDKLAAEEREWLKDYELVQAAKAKAEEQEKEIGEAKKIEQQCIDAKAAHEKAKKDLVDLFSELFDGPTPSFPSEDALEQSLAAARARFDDIQVVSKRETYVLNTLQKAHACLLGALQELQSSLGINSFDFFAHSGYMDIMINSSLARARDFTARAEYLIQEVRRIEPNIPHLGDLSIEQYNLVFNVLFDNIFTDLRVRQIIQDALQKVARATLTLQKQILPESIARTQGFSAQLESSQTEVKRLQKAMWNERSRIMMEVLDGRDGNPTAGDGKSVPAPSTAEPSVAGPSTAAGPSTSSQPPPAFDIDNDDDLASDEAPPPYSVESGYRTRT